MDRHETQRDSKMTSGYGKLAIALVLSVLVMYPLTMAFVVRWSDFYLNLSNFCMAVMMVAPMGLIMLRAPQQCSGDRFRGPLHRGFLDGACAGRTG